jgi:hypothetical protein
MIAVASTSRLDTRPEPRTSTRASREAPAPRQLFDHRKDDPMRFALLSRNSKTSESHASASETNSQTSSVFTLSSTTDGSSASSAVFDNSSQPSDTGNKFSAKLKLLYRTITRLETAVKAEDADDGAEEPSRAMLASREVLDEEGQRDRWIKHLADHKECVFFFL